MAITQQDPKGDVAPDRVDRQFAATEPNQLWVAVVTYVPTVQGWLYRCSDRWGSRGAAPATRTAAETRPRHRAQRPHASPATGRDGALLQRRARRRRGVSIDEGLEWLRDAVARCRGLGPEQPCDAVLAQLADGLEDDVALMAVRLEVP